jgi:hypothetical protein
MDQESPPAPALRPSLEQVRGRFEIWRKRKKVDSRIPKSLWQAAVQLCQEHSVLEVSRTLRLNYNDLKDRVGVSEKRAVSGADRSVKFVEVGFEGVSTPSECVVEMEAANGAKLKMHFRGQQRDFDPVELARAFWRQGL